MVIIIMMTVCLGEYWVLLIFYYMYVSWFLKYFKILYFKWGLSSCHKKPRVGTHSRLQIIWTLYCVTWPSYPPEEWLNAFEGFMGSQVANLGSVRRWLKTVDNYGRRHRGSKYYEVSITWRWLVYLLGEGVAGHFRHHWSWKMNHCSLSFLSLNLTAKITQRTIKYL